MKIRLIEALLNAVFPPRCALCNEIIAPIGYFCKDCECKVEFTVGKRCIGCGLPVKKCDCNRFIYHFDGIVSPFYNSGAAKEAYYNFKFFKNKRVGDYFSENMAQAVRRAYKNYRFDFVTYVSPLNEKTDYDHCGILAKRVAKLLKLKLVKTLRGCKERSVQHTLDFSDRFDNVYNAYEPIASYKGKRILLVDDIKTSGATIDECARQLKFAGAKTVYCVSALIGFGKNRD